MSYLAAIIMMLISIGLLPASCGEDLPKIYCPGSCGSVIEQESR